MERGASRTGSRSASRVSVSGSARSASRSGSDRNSVSEDRLPRARSSSLSASFSDVRASRSTKPTSDFSDSGPAKPLKQTSIRDGSVTPRRPGWSRSPSPAPPNVIHASDSDQNRLPKKDAAFHIQQFFEDQKKPSLPRHNTSNHARVKSGSRSTSKSTSRLRSRTGTRSPSRCSRSSCSCQRSTTRLKAKKGKDEPEDRHTTMKNIERKIHNSTLYQPLDPLLDTKETMSCPDPIPLWFNVEKQFHPRWIEETRAEIKKRAYQRFGTTEIHVTNDTLIFLVQLYDELFFRGQLSQSLEKQKTELRVGIGLLAFMKRAIALCGTAGNMATITFHPDVNRHTFDGVHVEKCNGVFCKDRLEYVQLVLEHELVHLIIQVSLRKFKENHGACFQKMAKCLFGHLEYGHETDPIKNKKKMNEKDSKVIAEEQETQQKIKKEASKPLETRLREAEEIEKQKSMFCVGDLVINRRKATDKEHRIDVLGIVIYKSKTSMNLLCHDGSIIEKFPFSHAHLIFAPTPEKKTKGKDGKERGDLKQRLKRIPPRDLLHPDHWDQMVRWTWLFMVNKKTFDKNQWVMYKNERGEVCRGKVIAKKPMSVQIQINPTMTCLIPYHCISKI